MTFGLVHGACIGGWVWRWVAAELRAAGHEVFTPTLTGHGERVHLARPDIDLDTHIQDVANLLRYQDLMRNPVDHCRIGERPSPQPPPRGYPAHGDGRGARDAPVVLDVFTRIP